MATLTSKHDIHINKVHSLTDPNEQTMEYTEENELDKIYSPLDQKKGKHDLFFSTCGYQH